MVRIERGLWCVRSEGDFRRGNGTACDAGGSENYVLDWVRQNGIADPECFPWVTDERPYTPSQDRSGRTVYSRIGAHLLDRNDIEGQKNWLDTVGPITGFISVYQDFNAYRGTFRVYHRDLDIMRNPMLRPDCSPNCNHVVLIIGYDDDEQCWIIKNSWGQQWGTNGFGRIGYGEISIDANSKFGTYDLELDPWMKRRLHNGNFLESEYGPMHRNLEMAVTDRNQIKHWYLTNGQEQLQWRVYATFGNDASAHPAMIHSTIHRNFDVVYPTVTGRLHHWFMAVGSQDKTPRWNDGGIFGPTDVEGVPGFSQSSYSSPGDFEVVVRTSDDRLGHWRRTNAIPSSWNHMGSFANDVAHSGGSLIQSSYGNMELVCTLSNGEMQHWWYDGAVWNPSATTFGTNVRTAPFMIEGQFGAHRENSPGNFELCVAINGQVEHWTRDSQISPSEWVITSRFGHDVSAVTGLIQSSFGLTLQVMVLRNDNQLQSYWLDGSGWHEGITV